MERRAFVRSTVAAAVASPFADHRTLAELYHSFARGRGDVEAVTGDGRVVTLRTAALEQLQASLRGPLLLANSPGYDEARRVLNPIIDKRPALIVRPTSTADVRTAVAFAREYSLLLAVKCGGHSFSGQSTCDRGMMIDLARLRGVKVDPAARKARVAGGTLLGALDQAAMAHGLVTPMGTVSHTGVGGLTTGGGFGRVARRFGLALDNVTTVEVVTADGKSRAASKTENEDLFWGVRGGGGNFGIVTSFEFQLHPMRRRVLGGNILYPLAKAKEVWNLYADYAAQSPDELYLDVVMALPPGGGEGTAGFHVCYSGAEGEAARVLEPIRRVGTSVADKITPIDYVALQRSGDVTDPRAMGMYVKSGFVPRITPELVSAIVEGFEAHPARMTQVVTQHAGGAIGRVPPGETAFAHRDGLVNLLVLIAWPAGQDGTGHMNWARKYWATLEPYTNGWYTNEVADETAAVVNANYRDNYSRLVALKNKYDPTNLFRLNANVQPNG